MQDTSQDTMMTTSDVADRCGVSTKTVRRWIHEGNLDAVKLPGNGHYRVDPDALQAFLGDPASGSTSAQTSERSSRTQRPPGDQEAPSPTDGGENVDQAVQQIAGEGGTQEEPGNSAEGSEGDGSSEPTGHSYADLVEDSGADRADDPGADHAPPEDADPELEQGSETSPDGHGLQLADEFEVIL